MMINASINFKISDSMKEIVFDSSILPALFWRSASRASNNYHACIFPQDVFDTYVLPMLPL